MTFQMTLAKRGHLKSPILATRLSVDLIEQAERFFAGTAATFRHGGYRAFYAPGADVVQPGTSGCFGTEPRRNALRRVGDF